MMLATAGAQPATSAVLSPIGDPPSRVGAFSNEHFLPDCPYKVIKQVEDVAVDCISAD